jgi:hypothetical protein
MNRRKITVRTKWGRPLKVTVARKGAVPDLSLIAKVAQHTREQETMRFQAVGVRTTPVSQWKQAKLAQQEETE